MNTKRLFLLLALLLLLCSNCTDQNLTSVVPAPPTPPTQTPIGGVNSGTRIAIDAFRSLISTEQQQFMENQHAYAYRVENIYIFNYERFMREQLTDLNATFQMQNLDVDAFAKQLNVATLPVTFALPSQMTGVSTVFNQAQLAVLDPYVSGLYNATSAAVAGQHYATAKARVDNSTWGTDEKIEVLAVLETCNEFAKKLFNGSFNTTMQIIIAETGGTSLSGCQVSVRGVLGAAVVGGFAGAVRGAMIGGAGGTVAFPGLGTATGVVGGGVIGFANGFIGGGAVSVVEQLLLSCLRSTRTERTLPSYYCDTIEEMRMNQACFEKVDNAAAYRLQL